MSFLESLVSAAQEVTGAVLKQGYFDSYTFNVCGVIDDQDLKAFESADGNEFKTRGKACAAYSSSMFAYNFFSWIGERTPCWIDGIEYNERFFEVRIPCLKLNVSRANMDVVLVSNDRKHILFVESKLTEHLSCASSDMRSMLDKSYNNQNEYYVNGKRWKAIVNTWSNRAGKSDPCSGYFDGIKQEICHRIAIDNLRSYNIVRERFEKLNGGERCELLIDAVKKGAKLSFAALVFEPSKEYKKEHRAFEAYAKIHEEFSKSANDANDCGIKTYTELWNDKDFMTNMPDSRKEYLKERYMRFSSAKLDVAGS